MKTLVVYYSLTGRTKLVSQIIAETLNATMAEITEIRPRKPGGLTYLTGSFAALTNRGSKIRPVDVDLKQIDTILIGSPIWASRPTPAVNSFIYRANFEGRNIIPFFTLGGENLDKALANIKAKIERRQGRVVNSFAVTTYEVSDEEIMTRAKESAESLRSHIIRAG